MNEQKGSFGRLVTIMDELREKCPWDKKQTVETLRPLTIEETYELADAITSGDWKGIREELGDMLLHIVFYARIGKEQGQFTLEEVIELLSWRRLGLHAKPIVFLDIKGFWRPLFDLFDHILEQKLMPVEFRETWRTVERVEDILPTLRSMPTQAFAPGIEEMT